jgi:hypothetical protein
MLSLYLLINPITFRGPLFQLIKNSQSFFLIGNAIQGKIEVAWIKGVHHLVQLVYPAVHLRALARCLDTLVNFDPAREDLVS